MLKIFHIALSGAMLFWSTPVEGGVVWQELKNKYRSVKGKKAKSKQKQGNEQRSNGDSKLEEENRRKEGSKKTVIQTNENDFEKDVLAKDFVVVDFYANWCGPCRMILPYLEEIASELNVDIVKVNIDESPSIASDYNVMSIPTIIIFKNGEKVSTNIGAASKARLIDWITAHRK